MSEKEPSASDVPAGCPEYRVRIFLAADLSNSTAYKSSRDPREWVPTFREFYSNFSDLFARKHLQIIERLAVGGNPLDLSALKDRSPRFWKTVGDEIIFVNRVESCFEVSVLVMAFSEALTEYLNDLKSDEKKRALGIKGSGWIASFPFPNIAIEKPSASDSVDRDLNESEEIEASADVRPNEYEFLGKGLDYGFRIAQHSSDEFLALSPALASILVRPSENRDYEGLRLNLRVREPVSLKGVMGGKQYPAVGIPIDRNSDWEILRSKQEKLLSGDQSKERDISDYLSNYIELHEIEEPCLKVHPMSEDLEPPKYYLQKYVPDWKGSAEEVAEQDDIQKESEKSDGEKEIPAEMASKLIAEFVRKMVP